MAGILLGAWVVDSVLNGVATIAGGSSSTGDEVSFNTAATIDIGVEVAYGGTVSGGEVTISILKETSSGSFQSTADQPFQWVLLATASTTVKMGDTLELGPGKYKINISNPSGNSAVTPKFSRRLNTWG